MTVYSLENGMLGIRSERPAINDPTIPRHGSQPPTYICIDTLDVFQDTGSAWLLVGKIGAAALTDTGFATNIKTVTGSYGLLPTDGTVVSDSAGNTISLPDPATAPVGATYRIANSQNGTSTAIDVNAEGVLIGGLTTLFLPGATCCATCQSDGANYTIVDYSVITIDGDGSLHFAQSVSVDALGHFFFSDGTINFSQAFVFTADGTPTDFQISPTAATLPPLAVEGTVLATGSVGAFGFGAGVNAPGPVTGQVTGGTLPQLQASYAELVQQLHLLGFINNQTT